MISTHPLPEKTRIFGFYFSLQGPTLGPDTFCAVVSDMSRLQNQSIFPSLHLKQINFIRHLSNELGPTCDIMGPGTIRLPDGDDADDDADDDDDDGDDNDDYDVIT